MNDTTARSEAGRGDLGRVQYRIGVDGGGTGTRVVLTDVGGLELGRGQAGPSGLAHGIEQAWQAVLSATRQAFATAGRVMPDLHAIDAGCGLAGVNNVQWAAQFVQHNPGFRRLVAETDAYTTLLGAHQGAAGAIIALGTGSVGEVLRADGTRSEVGGWGFPASDEASGAWMGLRAMNHLQRSLDGRVSSDAFADAVLAQCGGDRNAVFAWLGQANQTRYAELAPLVIRHAGKVAAAERILRDAGMEVESMANALDPAAVLPIALCGGLAQAVRAYLPARLRSRVRAPLGDSASGALLLLRRLGARH